MSAKQQKWVTLGRISGVFGVKGWLKVQSFTEPRDNIVTFDVWTLRGASVEGRFEVEEGRSHAGSVVAKLRGIDDRDAARACHDAEIVVERERLPRVRDGEFYWVDLEGLEVRNLAGVVLGRVQYLLATGANDVLAVGHEPVRLIPFVMGQVVKEVDLAAGRIVVDWSPGD